MFNVASCLKYVGLPTFGRTPCTTSMQDGTSRPHRGTCAIAPMRLLNGNVSTSIFSRGSGALLLAGAIFFPALMSMSHQQQAHVTTDHNEQQKPLMLIAHQDQETRKAPDFQSLMRAYAAAQKAKAIASIAPTTPARPDTNNTPKEDVTVTGALAITAHQSNSLSRPQSWVEHVMTDVEVRDGRTLQQGDVVVTLAGLDVPAPDQMCRLLNGQNVPCAQRMATQLELLTRHRQITCRHRALPMAQIVAGVIPEATCRIGEHDLTARMEAGASWKMLADSPKIQQPQPQANTNVIPAPLPKVAPSNATPSTVSTPLPPSRPHQTTMLH